MEAKVRPYPPSDAAQAAALWNQVVEDGAAFPQTERLIAEAGARFCAEQSFMGIAVDGESGARLPFRKNVLTASGSVCA